MRTPEQRLATKIRKAEERAAHRERVMREYPPAVRYAKAKFQKGKKHQPKHRQPLKLKLGVQ
jgi:hypothetical protein